MFLIFKKIVSHYLSAKRWRKINSHNSTVIGKKMFNPQMVKVGSFTYGVINVQSTYSQADEKIDIGNFVSIADNVQFMLGMNHQTKTFTTFPLKSILIENSKLDALNKGPIVVEDEVWIGADTVILSGVKIGRGSIIATRSVVTRDIPPFVIAGGVPAKILKKRFPDSIIDKMLNIKLIDIPIEDIKSNIDLFYSEIQSLEDVEKIKKLESKHV
jgi:virginiamycin A acetyltransferase